MARGSGNVRINQRHRTRKDLLAAAGRLLKEGRMPDMDAVAAEAMVSRATVYRYFPTIESLLIEAPLESALPDPKDIFNADTSTDPVARIDKAEGVLHEICYRNAAQLRLMLASTLQHGSRRKDNPANGIPIRQNRRTGLIEAALAPARRRFDKPTYDKLCAALSLIFGTEAMIVFSDVLNLDADVARRVKSWAAKSLVETALREAAKGKPPRAWIASAI